MNIPQWYRVSIIAVLVALAPVWVTPASAGSYPADVVLVSRGLNYQPRTDGTSVVWSLNGQDIYGMDPADDRTFPIATGDPYRLHLGLDAAVAVWLETPSLGCSPCKSMVRGKDLASGQEWSLGIANGVHGFADVAISGGWVVWSSLSETGYQLIARNVRTMAPAVVLTTRVFETPTTYHDVELAVDGERVVWIEQFVTQPGTSRARMLSMLLSGSTPTTVFDEPRGSSGQSFDLGGDVVVYQRGERLDELKLHNLRTGETQTLDTESIAPTTDGRYVFWVHATNEPDNTFQIYGYDVLLGSRFVAWTSSVLPLDLHANAGMLVWLNGLSVRPYATEVSGTRIADVLPSARRSAPDSSATSGLYLAESGHTLGGGFRTFWEQSGGLPVFGYPLTEEFDEHNRDLGRRFVVQYLERQRYEYHPEHSGTPYEVLLGRLGVEMLGRSGRDWQTFPKAAPSTQHYFPQTGHAIAPQFWTYWRTHGLEFGDVGVTEREALALFGYPISEPQLETTSSGDRVVSQWFERARFEYHPDKPAEYRVLLGRLAADMLTERGW